MKKFTKENVNSIHLTANELQYGLYDSNYILKTFWKATVILSWTHIMRVCNYVMSSVINMVEQIKRLTQM